MVLTAFLATCLLLLIGITSFPCVARAEDSCPNEALRSESNLNPTTGAPYSQGLPECRAYEMVTPLEKGGGDVKAFQLDSYPGGGGMVVSPSGNSVGYLSQRPFADAENAWVAGGGAATLGYVGRRSSTGWTTGAAFPSVGLISYPYAIGLFDGDATADLTKTVSCGYAEARTNGLDGTNFACATRTGLEPWSVSVFPSLTGIPVGEANNPPYYSGSSADLSHIVFLRAPGMSNRYVHADLEISGTGGAGLYEVVNPGQSTATLQLVNVDDGGAVIGPTMGAVLGGYGPATNVSTCESAASTPGATNFQAISDDGEFIYFTACPGNVRGGPWNIYARIGGSETVDVSNPSPSECSTCSGVNRSASYAAASSDGKQVFFTTAQQLVDGDTDSTTDLYEYDFEAPAGHHVVQLSAGEESGEHPDAGRGAEVQGVVSASSDGSRVYFVARGVLTTHSNTSLAPGQQQAVSGADNLYLYDGESGETKFVADLSPADSRLWELNGAGQASGPTSSASSFRASQISADGRYLIFTTVAALSADDTDTALDVYRYDSVTGDLLRVSHGEAAFPFSDDGNSSSYPAIISTSGASGDGEKFGGSSSALASSADAGRSISGDGAEVIFSTSQQLQSDDLNGAADVYEWVEDGVDGCSEGDGCVHMISSGTAPGGAYYPALSVSGEDIFFATRAELVGQDTDELVDVYDARVDGGLPYTPPSAGCATAESCRPGVPLVPVAAPNVGSQSVTGSGNPPRPTPHKHAHRRKKKRHHHHHRSHRRKGRGRPAGHKTTGHNGKGVHR